MSGIVGVFYRDGRPVKPATLEKMVSALALLGPDGRSQWQQGPVGLGHLMLHNTPESLHETHPLRSEDGNLTLVSTTRIDNREELLDAYRVPRTEWRETTDSWLCLRAYQEWGEACADRLIGDWAFALWDELHQKLFVARDHHGIPGVFYYSNDRVFAFASSVKGLLGLDEVPGQLDEEYLARSMVFRPPADQTLYDGIRILHGAHTLTVTAEKVEKKRYYYLEQAPDVRLASDDDYVEAFNELFEEAIRCRLRGLKPVGISLSGGLDSGSIAVVAAKLLDGARLRAFTALPHYPTEGLLPPGRYGDEKPYVEAIRRKAGNIDVNYIPNEGESPLAACLWGTRLCDVPFPVANLLWIRAVRDKARELGLGVMLTGFGGNASISWYGQSSVLGGTDWRNPAQVLRDLGEWRQRHGLSFLRAVKNQLIRPLFPFWMVHRYNTWRHGQMITLDDSPVNAELARKYRLEEWLRSELRRPAWMLNADSRAGRNDVLRPGEYSAPFRVLVDSGRGLETRDPALDKRILEFCLGIPDDQYGRNGETRLLIRRAMKDLLPPLVLNNTKRELQSADIGYRLRETSGELRESLQKSEASALCRHYLDLGKIRRVLDRIDSDERIDVTLSDASRRILLRGLVMGEFLRR